MNNRRSAEAYMDTQIGIIRAKIEELGSGEFHVDTKRYFTNALDRLDETLFWVKKGVCKSKRFD